MKRNPEFPLLERPSIAALDAACGPYLDAKRAARRARDAEKRARELALDAMRQHESSLERDGDGNAVYVYRDGPRVTALTLVDASRLAAETIDDGEDLGGDDIG